MYVYKCLEVMLNVGGRLEGVVMYRLQEGVKMYDPLRKCLEKKKISVKEKRNVEMRRRESVSVVEGFAMYRRMRKETLIKRMCLSEVDGKRIRGRSQHT